MAVRKVACSSLGPIFDVVLLGISFFLIFTSFQSCGMIQAKVLEDAVNLTNTNSSSNGIQHNSGYISLGIIYVFLTFGNFIAAPIVNLIGPKLSMFFGGSTFALFLGSYLRLSGIFLYVCSAILGCGAALIWTAQGNYLTLCSDKDTMARNAGVFWALFQCSYLVGSAFIYAEFRGKSDIDPTTRTTVYIVFTVLACAGTLLLLVLRHPKGLNKQYEFVMPQKDSEEKAVDRATNLENMNDNKTSQSSGFLENFAKFFLLFGDLRMILLSIVFGYVGLELAFYSGVYGTALANTKYFRTDANSMIGLSGIFIGVGEVLGGSMFGIFQSKTIKFGRNPVVLLGLMVHILAFCLILVNIPEVAPMRGTEALAFIRPSKHLGIFCSFLLGYADSCWNTQCYAILGSIWKDDSAPAFAFFKFCQALAAAIGFFYTPYVGLRWQLLILVIMATMGALAYFMVDRLAVKTQDLQKTIANLNNNEMEVVENNSS